MNERQMTLFEAQDIAAGDRVRRLDMWPGLSGHNLVGTVSEIIARPNGGDYAVVRWDTGHKAEVLVAALEKVQSE